MKKKFFSVIVAIIAMLALSLNVFAANSIVGSIDMPQASSDKGSVTLGKVPSGKYSRNLQDVIDRLNNAARNSSVKNAFGDKLPSICMTKMVCSRKILILEYTNFFHR